MSETQLPPPRLGRPNLSLPVHAIAASDEGGGRPVDISTAQVRSWLDRTNDVYRPAGIELTWDGTLRPLEREAVNSLEGDGDAPWKSAKAELNDEAIKSKKVVVVFRHGKDKDPGAPPGAASRGGRTTGSPCRASTTRGCAAPRTSASWPTSSATIWASRTPSREIRPPGRPSRASPSCRSGTRTTVRSSPPSTPTPRSSRTLRRDTAVWRRSTEPEIQIYGASYEEGGDIRYVAAWRPGNHGERQRYESDYKSSRATYDELWPEGWRLAMLSVVQVGGSGRYTAVWRWPTAAHAPRPSRCARPRTGVVANKLRLVVEQLAGSASSARVAGP